MDIRAEARRIAQEVGVDPDLFVRLINQESGFRTNVVSPRGAIGPAQLMPGTARDLGVDPTDPIQNLYGGARYLKQQIDTFGNPMLGLAAYNAGPGNVKKYGGIPPFEETQNYVQSIMGGYVKGDNTMNGQPKQQMPMQQPQQKRSGLMGLVDAATVRDPNTGLTSYQRFAAALDPLIMPSMRAGEAIRQSGAQRVQRQKMNKTIEWLRSNGYADAAAMIEQNPAIAANVLSSVMADRMQKPGPVKGVAVDGNIVNPYTGEVIYQAEQKGVDPKLISDARKEFQGLKPVKDFADASAAYSRVVRSAEDPSPAGDLALIFNYMKVLDPGSVVREGEFATAQNAGGVDERIRSLYNRVIEGTRLTEPQRADFVDRASRLYRGAEEQYNSIANQYKEFARKAGLPVDQVIPDFTYKGSIPERSTLIQVPPNPDTSRFPSSDDWKNHWQNVMTEEQRRAYLEG